MILLMHQKYFEFVTLGSTEGPLDDFIKSANIPNNTPICFLLDLPEEDDEGNPIFAFVVDGSKTRYWTGKAIQFPQNIREMMEARK